MLDLPLTLTDIILKPARICLITRMDGEIIRIAEAQTDLIVDGETYSPLAGFQLSAVQQQVGGESSSVQIDAAMTIGGVFDLYEVVDGKFDNATVQIGIVNRASPSIAGFLFKGFIGPVAFGALQNVVSFDVRGYSLKTMWPFIQTFGPMCRADFGDDLCRVPLRPSLITRNRTFTTRLLATSVAHYAARVSNGLTSDPDQYANIFFECTTAGVTHASVQPTYNFSVGATTTDGTAVFTARDAWTRHAKITSIPNQFNIVLDRDPDPRGVTGWYNQGAIRMWDGYSATRAFEIGAWVLSTRTLTLYLPVGAANNDTLIHPGDWLEIWPGCDFTIAKCSGTYANSEQFRGEPYFAGADLVGAPTGSSGAGYWTPGELDSLALWFDFSDVSTIIQAANAISQVNDKSGNDLHITQIGGAAKPTWAVGQNGLHIASFDGADYLNRTSALGGLVPSNNQTILAVNKGLSATGGYIYFGQNGTVAGSFFRSTTQARLQGNSNDFANYDPTEGWRVHSGYILTTLREIYEDGTVEASNTAVETLESPPIEIWVGARPGPTSHFTGEIGELIICTGQLSTPDRQKLEGYAAHKWNLTINLPSTHPYKISPPSV